MVKQIGNFFIEENEEEKKILMHYSLSLKDWIDFLFKSSFATFSLILSFLLFYEADFRRNFTQIIIGMVFSTFGISLLINGISTIIRVRKSILIIDKKDNVIIHRNTLFTSQKYDLSSVKTFSILINKEEAHFTVKKVNRMYANIQIQMHDNSIRNLFTINTKKNLKSSDSLQKAELMNDAEQIIKELDKYRINTVRK